MYISPFPARALACLLLAAASGHAGADPAAHPGAADPRAQVPATIYRPLLAYRAEAQPDASPDQGWQAGNAAVAGYQPMMLTMKPRGGQAAPASAPVPAPAQPPVDQAAPHAGHDHHRHGADQ